MTLDELCDVFHISKSTLRRDLPDILQHEGFKKIYGGVTYQPQKKLVPFGERNILELGGKKAIAARAAELVEDNDIIFVDTGTTTLYMVEGLKLKHNLIVLTNNLEFIFRALPFKDITIISLSGTLDRQTLSFTGPSAAEILRKYNVCKAFMATTGFSATNGVTNSSPPETLVKQTAVDCSGKIFLLADHNKFGAVSLTTYCRLDQVDVLITDRQPPADLAKALDENNVRVLLPGEAAPA